MREKNDSNSTWLNLLVVCFCLQVCKTMIIHDREKMQKLISTYTLTFRIFILKIDFISVKLKFFATFLCKVFDSLKNKGIFSFNWTIRKVNKLTSYDLKYPGRQTKKKKEKKNFFYLKLQNSLTWPHGDFLGFHSSHRTYLRSQTNILCQFFSRRVESLSDLSGERRWRKILKKNEKNQNIAKCRFT